MAEVGLIILEKLFDGDFGFGVVVFIKIFDVILDLTAMFGELNNCWDYECDLQTYFYEDCLCSQYICEQTLMLFF